MNPATKTQKRKVIALAISGIVLGFLLLATFRYDLECRYKVGFVLKQRVFVDSLYVENTWSWTIEKIGKLLLENQLKYVETDRKRGPGFPIGHSLAGYGSYLQFSIIPYDKTHCFAFDYESKRSAYFLPALRHAGLPAGHCVAVYATRAPQSRYKMNYAVKNDGNMKYETISYLADDEEIASQLTMNSAYGCDKGGCWVCENNSRANALAGPFGPFDTGQRVKLRTEDKKSGSVRYTIGKVTVSEIERAPNRVITTDEFSKFWLAKWIDEGSVFLTGRTLQLLKENAVVRVWLGEVFSGAGSGWDFASLERHGENIRILGIKRGTREKKIGLFTVSPEGEPIDAIVVDLGDIGLDREEQFIVEHSVGKDMLNLAILISLNPSYATQKVDRILRYTVGLN